MFRSLLNTLPIISGNHTIACKINTIFPKTDVNYYVYISQAELKPLNVNHSLPSSININLMNGKYGFDVQRYAAMTNIFKDTYVFEPFVFKTLDTVNQINDRNKTFEFGCQRISYQHSKFEWSFYAPIYINNLEDLPDYFVIDVKHKDSGKILKHIKIAIGKRYNTNKLYYYLQNHINLIKDNIPIIWHYKNNEIVLNNIIDCESGSIVTKTVNANNQLLYHNHVTINEFDYMISNLYTYNKSIMSEVIPLSFEFNLKDFLNDNDEYYFEFNEFEISGYYEKDAIKQDFYMFDVNSHSNTAKSVMFDIYNNVIYTKEYNVYHVNNINTLSEATNETLRHSNTLNKTYCKWNNYDNDDYTINNNAAYSTEYNKYGNYPIYKTNSMTMKLHLNYIDDALNAIVPVYNDESINAYDSQEQYLYQYLMNNHITTWFDVYSDNAFDNIDKWSDINQYNYTSFCKGLLYHNLPKEASKFNVFVNLNYVSTDGITLANILYNNDEIDISAYNNTYELYHILSSLVQTNTYLRPVTNTDEITADGDYYIEEKYIDNEQYILFNDLSKLSAETYSEIQACLDCNVLKPITDYVYINELNYRNIKTLLQEYGSNNSYLDIYYLDNVTNHLQELQKFTEQTDDELTFKLFQLTKLIYLPAKEQIISDIDKYLKLLKQTPNAADRVNNIDVTEFDNIINNSADFDTVSYSTKIKYYLILYKILYTDNKLNDLQFYFYATNNVINDLKINYFVAYNNKNSNTMNVYVDPYNLSDFCKRFGITLNNSLITDTKEVYCEFINKDHLVEYCNKLYSTQYLAENIANSKDLLKSLYIKKCELNKDTLESNVYVCSLFDYLYDENTNIEKSDIECLLNNTTYDSANNVFKTTITNFDIDMQDDDISAVNRCIQGQFTYQLMFKKKLIILNDALANALDKTYNISDDQTINVNQYLYYYYSVPNVDLDNIDLSFSHISNNLFNKKIEISDIVKPVFSTVYLSETFLNDNNIFLNNISNYKYPYKYNIYNQYAKVYKHISAEQAQTLDEPIYAYVKISNFNYADFDGEIHTKQINDTTIAYILIDEYISTNTLSYNVNNEIYQNSNINIEYVNGVPNDIDTFTILYPFMKNDIFYDVIHTLYDYIVLPTNIKLLQKYKSVYVANNTETQLIENPNKQYLSLNRYFYNIKPTLIQIDNVMPDYYKEIYKTEDCKIKNTNRKYESYRYNPQCNIYNNDDVMYISDVNDLEDNLHLYHPTENKHFASNTLYHLPITFDVNTKSRATNDELAIFEKTDEIFNYFKNYIKNHYYNQINSESLLFLFNKYTYNIEKNIVQYNIPLNTKIYEVVYKFILK